MLDLVLATCAGALAYAIWARERTIAPVVALNLVFALAFALRSAGLLALHELTPTTFAIVLIGLLTVSGAHLLAAGPRRPRPFGLFLRTSRYVAVVLVVTAMSVAGFIFFGNSAAAMFGVASREDLTPYQIRLAETSGTSSIGTILVAAYPVLAVLAVIGYRCLSKYWIALAAIPVWLAGQGTNRTGTMIVGVTLGLALLASSPPRARPSGRWVKNTLMAAVTAFFALAYFNAVGQSLSKGSIGGVTSASWLPTEFTSFLLYLTGGPSALSVALESGVNPWSATSGWSYYAVLSALWLAGLGAHPPQLDVSFVQIPVAFNMYTGFGDVIFDVGPFGWVLYVLLMGMLSGTLTRLWDRRSGFGLFLMAYVGAIYAQFYFSASLLLTSTVATICIGAAAFYILNIQKRDLEPTSGNSALRSARQVNAVHKT